jgi:starch phosphorylase
MAQLTPRFSANRAVQTYTKHYYLPAATAYRDRAENNSAVAKQIVGWQHTLQDKWGTLRFGELKVESDAQVHTFIIEVSFGSLDPTSVRVELYAIGVNGGDMEHQEMIRGQPLTTENSYILSAQVPTTCPATDYTARIIPHHNGVAIPLEATQILWQR